MLSLVVLSAFVTDPPPVHSQSGAGSGSSASSPGGSQGTPMKPKGSKAGPSKPTMQPSDMPGQTGVPRERTQALEERLRSGRMEHPIAQDQISDRLEQLHGNSTERSTGDTSTDSSAK